MAVAEGLDDVDERYGVCPVFVEDAWRLRVGREGEEDCSCADPALEELVQRLCADYSLLVGGCPGFGGNLTCMDTPTTRYRFGDHGSR